MKLPLRILHLEDNLNDAEIVQTILKTGGFSCTSTCVQTGEAFVAALEGDDLDLILSDHTLPNFSGFHALEIARVLKPEIPFIFVSGTLGEEEAINSLKYGATDYVLKDGLIRLVPAVRRALQEVEVHAEQKRAGEQIAEQAAYLDKAQDAIMVRDLEGKILFWNKGAERIYGWSSQEVLGRNVLEIFQSNPKKVCRSHPADDKPGRMAG